MLKCAGIAKAIQGRRFLSLDAGNAAINELEQLADTVGLHGVLDVPTLSLPTLNPRR